MSQFSSHAARLGALACALFALATPSALAADRYVALGDSFASGVGTGSYTLSSSCKRSVYAYPYLVAQQRPNTALDFVACSGATTSSLMASQIAAVNAATTLVTVTIGGNDIRFADLIVQCTVSDCSSSLDSTRASLPTFLPPRLDSVYTAIRSQAAFGARIGVLGYPRMFGSAGCLGTLGISTTERTKANQLADALDQTIARAGRRLRVLVRERRRSLHRPRRLLVRPVAQRPQPLQLDGELPPEPERTRARLRPAGTERGRLVGASEEGADDVAVALGLLGRGRVRRLVEEGEFRAGDPVDEPLSDRGRAEVVPPGQDERRAADLSESRADVPAREPPGPVHSFGPHITS